MSRRPIAVSRRPKAVSRHMPMNLARMESGLFREYTIDELHWIGIRCSDFTRLAKEYPPIKEDGGQKSVSIWMFERDDLFFLTQVRLAMTRDMTCAERDLIEKNELNVVDDADRIVEDDAFVLVLGSFKTFDKKKMAQIVVEC